MICFKIKIITFCHVHVPSSRPPLCFHPDNDQIQLFDRCYFKEHNSAYGSVGHNRTEYIQVLRVVYTRSSVQHGAKPEPGTSVQKKMYYKGFTPIKIRRGIETSSGDDTEPLEYLYEDLRHLEAKVNAWLAYTGKRPLISLTYYISR